MTEFKSRKQRLREFLLPEGKTAASFVRSLRKLAGIRRASAGKYDCVLYDSFDGRAYAQNVLLSWVDREGGGILQALSARDTALLWEQPMKKPPPRFGWTIDRPDKAAWLERCMGLRALLPAIKLSVKRQTFRWTDDEDKTRAWIHVEDTEISTGGEWAHAGVRLVIEPLRGYASSVKRLEDRIIHDTGARIDPEGLFARLMERHSIEFARRSARLNVLLEPEMEPRAAIVKVLTFLADVMEVNEEGVMAAWDTEFLHDLRVAIRRTRSLLGQLKKQFSAEDIQPFRDEFAWLGQATGRMRDIDVYLLEIPEFQEMLPTRFRGDLMPVRDLLLKQQKAEHKKLKAVLRSKKYRDLMTRWRAFLEQQQPEPSALSENGATVAMVARKRIRALYKRVLKEGWAIDDESPAEDLHELRKSCKKLRYLIECFQSLFPADQIGAVIRKMKQLQENLGEFQDLDVQIDGLLGFAEQLDIDREDTPKNLLAMGAILGNLEHRKREVRTEFKGRFAAFSSSENRDRFNNLFRYAQRQAA